MGSSKNEAGKERSEMKVVDLGARGRGKGDCNTSREGLERREDEER
jgi:hypothetical protein